MMRPVLAALAIAALVAGCSSPAPTTPAPVASTTQSAAPSTPSTPATTPARTTTKAPTLNAKGEHLWPNNATVSHIFFHSLVIDPARAFAKSNPDAGGNSQYMVTASEFDKTLKTLYDKGYVMVHPQRLAARDSAGVMQWLPLYLPEGKKPLIISIDDVSYNSATVGQGFADRLTLTASGKVTNDYTDASGKTTQGAYDVPTVIDAFVAKHPDFSHEGDKGTIALTGYEGVLGYRSSLRPYGDNEKTRSEIAKAKKVANALKADGWQFANHSYGHKNFTKLTAAEIKTEIEKWKADVEPVLGKTPILIYAFGADIADGNTRYNNSNPKFAYLNGEEGYDYFFNVDASKPAWYQLDPTSLRGARFNIDGITLQRAIDGRQPVMSTFIDAQEVVDPLRPLPVPGA